MKVIFIMPVSDLPPVNNEETIYYKKEVEVPWSPLSYGNYKFEFSEKAAPKASQNIVFKLNGSVEVILEPEWFSSKDTSEKKYKLKIVLSRLKRWGFTKYEEE